MKKLKIGIIGIGRLGYEHACNIANRVPACDLVAISDKNITRAKEVAEELGVSAVYENPADLCNDPNVEAVAIVTNTASHVDMIELAMNAGKHVFCEKPLAETVEKCKRAEKIVEAHPELTFMLGFMRRYDKSYAYAKQKIEEGAIGTPYLVKATGIDPEAFVDGAIRFAKTSGGIFLDMAIHDIDLMRWFLGCEATEVYAMGATFKHPEFKEAGDDETGVAVYKFENGAMGMVHVGRTAPYGYHVETEIVGTEGTIRISAVPEKNQAMVYNVNGACTECVGSFPERFAESYLTEMEEFVNCALEGKQPGTTVYDGTKSTIIGYATTEAWKTGKIVKI